MSKIITIKSISIFGCLMLRDAIAIPGLTPSLGRISEAALEKLME